MHIHIHTQMYIIIIIITTIIAGRSAVGPARARAGCAGRAGRPIKRRYYNSIGDIHSNNIKLVILVII